MPGTQTSITSRFETVLGRATAKDRLKIEKHLAVVDSDAAYGRLWRRLMTELGEQAPLAMQSSGNGSWKFFVPDGKYRMQVFALEDAGNGTLRVYMPDVLDEAVKQKMLSKSDSESFMVNESRKPLQVESLGAAEAGNAPDHFKHLLGWNRKAIRVTLHASRPEKEQAGAVQALVALAAKKWSVPVTATATAVKAR
jgi:hypothetical protein